jgi:hypothetical protein
VPLRDRQRLKAIPGRGRNRDASENIVPRGLFQDLRDALAEIRERQVAVRVDHKGA